jgi:UDP-GlcNAc:undecaprenyl-phosphate GlcNAc-1-phosphate transferase
MRALLFGFAVALLLSLVLTPAVRKLALWLGALDPFSARKVLAPTVVPRLGGLGIAAAFYLAVGLLWLLGSTLARATLDPATPVGLILLGGVPILGLGAVDDLYGLRALPKLAVQIAVGVLLWGAGLRVLGTSSPTGSIELYGVLSCVVTVAWLVGVVNAVNLIDGLDGLASGVALFALGTTTVAALLTGDLLLALLTGTLAGAVLGFLRFNWTPASIMMGDTGSLFLGYLLATTSIWSVRKSATAVLVVFPVVALGLPLLDTSLTISRRLLAGRPVMQADRDHVHHRLLGHGLPVRRAVLVLYAVCAVFAALSLGMVLSERSIGRWLLAVAAGFALLVAYLLGYLRGGPQGLFAALRQRRRTQALLQRLDSAAEKLHSADGLPAVRAVIADFATALGRPLQLTQSASPAPLSAAASARADGPAVAAPLPATRYPVGTRQAVLGHLELPMPESALSPDERTLIQLLCDLLAPTLVRLKSS